MNRRSLFKSLLALPIVFLGSKLTIAEPEPKQTIYWTGTRIPIDTPLHVTFGCGHPGYLTKEGKGYTLIHHGLYSSNKIVAFWLPGDKIKYYDCPECFTYNFNKRPEFRK